MNTLIHMPAQRHTWLKDGRKLDGYGQPDGCDRTERVCTRCGLVKITVHPPEGLPFRQWRTPGGVVCPADAMPVCVAVEIAA